MDDLISRIKEWINSGNRGNCDYFIVDQIENLINEYEKALPPAEPKNKRQAIETSDTISRQVAIDALSTPHGILYPIRTIEALPPAQPERKTGRWVGARQYCRHLEEVTGEKYSPSGIGNMIYCDQCWKASDRKSNYCPDCGAKMDAQGEE